jgi:hypothetical protein
MHVSKLSSAIALAAALTACGGGGDVEVAPSNVDNSVDNSTTNNNTGGGGGTTNPCARYTASDGTTVRQGGFDGSNCTYDSTFVGENNPLTVDLTIPFISGVHIFQDSLFVGTNVDTGAAPAEGEGPTLTIAAGNTLAFSDSADYVLINRGSQIVANGSQVAPITFTAFTDAVTGTAGPEAVSLWGGMVINGNGITNNCTDAERANNQCHVTSEGKPSNYGGNDNDESSGSLRYVVIKHSGFEVVDDEELNGVTFNAVGSGTVIENLEVYSTFDDGVEFFGGAVNIDNLVAVYVRDDSIDFSDGYIGNITNALVIHAEADGNRCIEGDNIGESRALAGEDQLSAPVSKPVISNLTCITSVFEGGTHGDSEGPTFRRGARFDLRNAVVFGAYAADPDNDNECFELEEATPTGQGAQDGNASVASSVIACNQATKGALPNGDSVGTWITNSAKYAANVNNVVITTAGPDAELSVLDGFYTAESFADLDGNAFSVTPAGDAPHIGAVTRDDNWTANWTYGLHPENRGQPLWFE